MLYCVCVLCSATPCRVVSRYAPRSFVRSVVSDGRTLAQVVKKLPNGGIYIDTMKELILNKLSGCALDGTRCRNSTTTSQLSFVPDVSRTVV